MQTQDVVLMPSSGCRLEQQIVLSFDVEEHHRIEAAAGLEIAPELKAHYVRRVGLVTRWLLDRLAERDIKATFFIVGELACAQPDLVREIHRGGHEVASHGWDHRRILAMTPGEFREDLRRSKDTLEQIIGEPVLGYRAPTFSLVRQTGWAIDVLAEEGIQYDSSIYPVRHDRYGVPGAPRGPFLARGGSGEILELPPATLRIFNMRLPAGGGGYFRLLPPAVIHRAITQLLRECLPSVVMLYFHPWEFDPDQPRLPLPFPSDCRTYVGVRQARRRLESLISRYDFVCARSITGLLSESRSDLPSLDLTPDQAPWGPLASS
jgi:polysaccharide deacetylase family protein (PEP-CTERM system associated)